LLSRLVSEAAAYQRRLREAEQQRDALLAERDTLRSRLDAAVRADVEAIAAQRLHDATDLWASVELAEHDGGFAPDKVGEAVTALVKAKPHLARPGPQFDLGNRRPAQQLEPASMHDVLRGSRRT